MDSRAKALLTRAFGAAAAKAGKRGKKKDTSAVVSTVQSGQVRVSRNAACTCGSGKKLKKCCGVPAKQLVVKELADSFLAATKGIPQTAAAMLRAGIDGAEVYAYFHTADYICDDNRMAKTAEACAIWDAHVGAFMEVDAELQRRILEDITTVKQE
jgi:hypothetical protein